MLAAHKQVLGARVKLAQEPGAEAELMVDAGRSAMAVARLDEFLGKTDEAVSVYRKSESLLASLAASGPPAQAALAACRSALGELLASTGKTAEALAALRLARDVQTPLAAARPASNKRAASLPIQSSESATCCCAPAGLRRRRPITARRLPSDRNW